MLRQIQASGSRHQDETGASLTRAERIQLASLLRRLATEQGITEDTLPGIPPRPPLASAQPRTDRPARDRGPAPTTPKRRARNAQNRLICTASRSCRPCAKDMHNGRDVRPGRPSTRNTLDNLAPSCLPGSAAPDRLLTRVPVGGTVTVVTSPEKQDAVVITEAMPSLTPAQVYQLWVIGPAGARSAGLLSRTGQAGPVLATGVTSGDRIGITVEPSGGTSSPTTAPSSPSRCPRSAPQAARRPAGNSRPPGDGHLAALNGDGRHWSAAVVSYGAGPGCEQSPSPPRAGR